MGFTAGTIDELPKARRAPRVADTVEIDALYALVAATPGKSTASDGVTYLTKVLASAAAGKAKRMLLHKTNDPTQIKTRTYPVSGGFAWAVWLTSTNEVGAEAPQE